MTLKFVPMQPRLSTRLSDFHFSYVGELLMEQQIIIRDRDKKTIQKKQQQKFVSKNQKTFIQSMVYDLVHLFLFTKHSY